MLLINEKDLEWAVAANPSLSLKNILTNHNICSGKVSCGVSKWAFGKGGVPHTHVETNQDEIYIVLRGRGIADIEGELREVGPGDILHARCGEVHGMVEGLTPDGIEMFYILLPTEQKEGV